jgi:hypothetical protein
MAVSPAGKNAAAALGPRATDPAEELRNAAHRTIANKDFEADVPAPTGYDAKSGVSMNRPSMTDQRQHGVVSRMAFNVAGELFIQETVMAPNGDTKELWKRGKHTLPS